MSTNTKSLSHKTRKPVSIGLDRMWEVGRFVEQICKQLTANVGEGDANVFKKQTMVKM